MNATQTKSPASGLITSDEMDLLLSGAPSDVEQKRAALAAILSRALVKNINNVEAHATLVAALEQNTHFLSMIPELLRDGPHVGKIQFVEEQIAENRATLKQAKQ